MKPGSCALLRVRCVLGWCVCVSQRNCRMASYDNVIKKIIYDFALPYAVVNGKEANLFIDIITLDILSFIFDFIV